MSTYTMARPLPRPGGSSMLSQLVLVGIMVALVLLPAYRASRARWNAFQLAPEWGAALVPLNIPSRSPAVGRHRRRRGYLPRHGMEFDVKRGRYVRGYWE